MSVKKLARKMMLILAESTGTFDDHEWNDTLSVLTARFSKSVPPSTLLSREQTIELFQSLSKIVWSLFSKYSTDLESIAYLAAKFWPKWLECVECSNRECHELFRCVQVLNPAAPACSSDRIYQHGRVAFSPEKRFQ